MVAKVVPISDKPCLALWVPCAWTSGDFSKDAEEFFHSTGVVDFWKWENGSTYPLRFRTKNGSNCSVSTEKWVVWNPNTKEFFEYSDKDFWDKFLLA